MTSLHQQKKRFKGKREKRFPWDQPVYCLVLLFSFFVYFFFKHSSTPCLESSPQLAATVERNSQILQGCSGPRAPLSSSRSLGAMPPEVTGITHARRALAAPRAQAKGAPAARWAGGLLSPTRSHRCCPSAPRAGPVTLRHPAGGLTARALLPHIYLR